MHSSFYGSISRARPSVRPKTAAIHSNNNNNWQSRYNNMIMNKKTSACAFGHDERQQQRESERPQNDCIKINIIYC